MSAPLFHMIASASEPVAPFSHGVEQDGWVFVTALSNSCVLRRSPGKKVGEGSWGFLQDPRKGIFQGIDDWSARRSTLYGATPK